MTREQFLDLVREPKGTNASESSGLGLAMVKQICDQYNFLILYEWNSGTHIFTVEF